MKMNQMILTARFPIRYLMKFLYFFSQGHEGKFSVYVHASKDKPVHFSRYFVNREIRSDKVSNFVPNLNLSIIVYSRGSMIPGLKFITATVMRVNSNMICCQLNCI